MAGACANGYILFCHVIERQACYKNYLAKVTEKRTITIEDMSNETKENLEFPARVIQMMLRYSYLVVTTPSQCYIYNVNNWNTPTIFDIKERSLILLMLCDR